MTEKRNELCRLCAEAKEKFIGIFDEEGQRLDIDKKITKCLQIQVCMDDCLPLNVCTECCIQLNQCNDFHEKSYQAQCSLQQMLDVKSNIQILSSQQNIEYTENPVLEKEVESYIDTATENDNSYEDDTGILQKIKTEQSVGELEEKEFQNIQKEYLPNEIVKKKVRKKSNLDKKSQNFVKEGGFNRENEKTVTKIPDNYMTGKKSDMDQIANEKKDSAEENSKMERKRNLKIERYPWLCTDCNDKLPSLEALEEHHKTIHNQNAKYMCVQCCKVYEKYYGFLTHVKRHKNKMKYTCDDCGKTFVHKKVLETHRAVHSDQRPHVCRTCGKAFRQQSALYIHSRCHLPDEMKNRYPCDQCDKSFSTKPNLVTHKRIHSGVRNFTCDQCGKSFIQKGNLEAHFLTHSLDKPYKCNHCDKGFKTPLQLKKHETVHTGAKPHQCAVCGRTFREKGTLREHHRIHTGAMPFSCEFCGKSFRFKGILTTHRRQHTGERPYSCLECQHHFTNWPNYNKHMKRRHGINKAQSKNQQQTEIPSQQDRLQAQENLQKLQQPQDIQTQRIENDANDSGRIHLQPEHVASTTVQVIQTVPHVTVTTQPIVLQSLPTNSAITAIQTFSEPTNATSTNVHQQPRHGTTNSSTYFNAISTPLTTFLPYNFYNVSNVAESDLIHHR